ncbi:MAG: EamA family transporter [Prochloraceae cyanobacterium]
MKQIILLGLLVTTQAFGDICLSRAMKVFGEVQSFQFEAIQKLILYLFGSPWIWLGVSTLTLSMLLYLLAISKLDVSYVLPIHASSYLLNAIMAWSILHESVTPVRWLATIVIGIGVFIVSLSEAGVSLPSSKQKKKKSNAPFMFLLPFGLHLPKIWLGVAILALADSAGDILTAKGMKQLGDFSLRSISSVFVWLGKIITHPYIIAGIGCYALSFLTFISLLSWADISLIRPATAMGYAFSILGSALILHEKIPKLRLIGISVIGLGVSIISFTSDATI